MPYKDPQKQKESSAARYQSIKGLHECVLCKNALVKDRALCDICTQDRDKVRAQRKASGICRVCGQDAVPNRIHCAKCADKHNTETKVQYRRTKGEVFGAYGGYRCVGCGVQDEVVLSIDHIDGKGNEHRKIVGAAGSATYYWLKRNHYPPGFRVLCMNCQFRARAGYQLPLEKIVAL